MLMRDRQTAGCVVSCGDQDLQRIPVYVSFEDFPRSASLRIMGYLEGFVGSIAPGAAMVGLFSLDVPIFAVRQGAGGRASKSAGEEEESN